MSEQKRATWAEFVKWVAENLPTKGNTTDVAYAARWVDTERASVAVLVATGANPGAIEIRKQAWLSALRAQGILPPTDPPSVAKALEIVAGEIADAGETFCADMSGDEARRTRLAFGCSVAIVRTLARDFA